MTTIEKRPAVSTAKKTDGHESLKTPDAKPRPSTDAARTGSDSKLSSGVRAKPVVTTPGRPPVPAREKMSDSTEDLLKIKQAYSIDSYDDTASDGASVFSTPTAPAENDLIRVCVRVRPVLANDHHVPSPPASSSHHEEAFSFTSNAHNAPAHHHAATKEHAASVPWIYDASTIYNPTNKEVVYKYDHIFPPTSDNNQIYETMVKSVVASTMNGYHGSVFSYGQTASGKTFTMNGNASQTGIIPLAVYQCFNTINQYPKREFLFRISYLEVYNEQIKDLLTTDVVPIKIQFDAKINATVVTGIKEVVVTSPAQVLALMKTGEHNKHVGATDMNEKSSRAHTIFRVFIESKDRAPPKGSGAAYYAAPIKVSTLNLVDLAGSESAKMTNSKGERAREAKHINQSLLTLSTIIQRLSEHCSSGHGAVRKQHLPYRDSKLTRLLEASLDGNAQIAIVCTISPTLHCVDETNNTLKFASRAKLIKMAAKMNETVDDKTLLRAYREEIEILRAKLQLLESAPPAPPISIPASPMSVPPSPGDMGTPTLERRRSLVSMRSIDCLTPRSAVALAAEKAAAERVEEEKVMLHMISEMEKLILKADLAKAASPGPNADIASLSGRRHRHHAHSHSDNQLHPGNGDRGISINLFPEGNGNGAPGSARKYAREAPPLSHSNGVAADTIINDGQGTTPGNAFTMSLDSPKLIPLNNARKSVSPVRSFPYSGIAEEKPSPAEGLTVTTAPTTNTVTTTSSSSGSDRPPPSPSRPSGVPRLAMRSTSMEKMDTSTILRNLNRDVSTFDDIVNPQNSSSSSVPAADEASKTANTEPSSASAAPTAPAADASPLHRTNSLRPGARVIHTVSSVIAQYTSGSKGPAALARQKSSLATPASISSITEAGDSAHSLIDETVKEKLTVMIRTDSDVATTAAAAEQSTTESAAGASDSPGKNHSPMRSAMRKQMKSYRKAKSSVDMFVAKSGSLDQAGGDAIVKALGISSGNDSSFTVVNPKKPKENLESILDEVQVVQVDEYSSGDDSDGDYSSGGEENVLVGVTKMLNILKGYLGNKGLVTKPSVRTLKGKTLSGFLQSQEAEGAGGISPVTPTASTAKMAASDPAQLERLRLDLKLKEADNKFLQQELDAKDQMLSVLTEGLKEVEISQTQWLTTNQELSYELDKALQSIVNLKAENRALREQLFQAQRAAATATAAATTATTTTSNGST